MKEQAIQFGSPPRLLGILSRPPLIPPGTPALLIPNTGFEHRVGPHRLHVHLCRALADAGFPTLRLDLSGLGDSPASSTDAVSDLQAAMDRLSQQGTAQHFGLIGLCSGANDAHLAALADPRVIGAAFIDHYCYPTARFRRNFWRERLLDWRRARNFLSGLLPRREETEKDRFRADQIEYFAQPSADDYAAQLQRLVDRDLALYFLYTGEVLSSYNYREQLTDAFPVLRKHQRLTLHFMPHADHTFSQIHMRKELVEGLRDWAIRFLQPDLTRG